MVMMDRNLSPRVPFNIFIEFQLAQSTIAIPYTCEYCFKIGGALTGSVMHWNGSATTFGGPLYQKCLASLLRLNAVGINQ